MSSENAMNALVNVEEEAILVVAKELNHEDVLTPKKTRRAIKKIVVAKTIHSKIK